MATLISKINNPEDLKSIPQEQLSVVAGEIRDLIIDVVSKTGGHLASSLGVVELIIALHYVLEMPKDKLILDVGHQCYAHKILTGRRDNFYTLRQTDGLSGFPKKDESEYDLLTSGHSSTSISFVLGLAVARDLKKEDEEMVAVIGDGALSSGLAFEGLNNAGQFKKDLIIVLNSNEMSISASVGALSSYLNRIITNPLYNKVRDELRIFVERIPKLGHKVVEAARRLEEGIKNLVVPGIFFEELGFRYFGPIDGHNIDQLIATLKKVIKIKGPKIIHVVTKKGKGYKQAEDNPSIFHSSKPFNKVSKGAIEFKTEKESQNQTTYTDVFGQTLINIAEERKDVVAITAAMPLGTGLDKFAERFPERFFDVGIAEQHALVFAAGLAKKGFRPVVAVYSTFLQRAYDQIFHDICLQDLPVVLCLDRAGLTGEDGPTHHGVFDIAYLRHLPNLVIMSPKDADELISMLYTSLSINHPTAIRYPKKGTPKPLFKEHALMPVGKSEILKVGEDICILAYGSMVENAERAAEILENDKIKAEVVNMRFIKPIDEGIINSINRCHKRLVTIEEGSFAGGAGSAVLEFLQAKRIEGVNSRSIAFPDKFIEHGQREILLERYGLEPKKIADFIKREFFK